MVWPVLISNHFMDAQDDFDSYLQIFNLACAAANFDDARKLLVLPSYLRDSALSAFLELTTDQKDTYRVSIK